MNEKHDNIDNVQSSGKMNNNKNIIRVNNKEVF